VFRSDELALRCFDRKSSPVLRRLRRVHRAEACSKERGRRLYRGALARSPACGEIDPSELFSLRWIRYEALLEVEVERHVEDLDVLRGGPFAQGSPDRQVSSQTLALRKQGICSLLNAIVGKPKLDRAGFAGAAGEAEFVIGARWRNEAFHHGFPEL